MALTANDYARQIVAQVRILDPSFSGEIGTPERKIIDSVAQALADAQVDLLALQGALDIDSKYGASLDRFTALFGFQRRQARAATGYVVFSRNTPAPVAVAIPVGVVVQASTSSDTTVAMQYTTMGGGAIAQGDTSSNAVPIQAISTGTLGNVAANTVTMMVGNPVGGVTAVTNPNPLVDGFGAEDDNTYKTRFINTIFRNLAGTEDQYLALAIAGPSTTKANVVGIQSRYQEYIQVPDYDDAGYVGGALTDTQSTQGTQGVWTSALSDIPYAKQIYTTTDQFLSNGQVGPQQYFYRPGTDFVFNYPPTLVGDTVRDNPATFSVGSQTLTNSGTANYNVQSISGFPSSGRLIIDNNIVTYSGVSTSGSPHFTGCEIITGLSSDTIAGGTPVWSLAPITNTAPNFSFINVFNPPTTVSIPGLQAVAPGDIILSEYSYVSSASRNDLTRNITNAVDVYINGVNDVQASCVFLPSNIGSSQVTMDATSPWYYENFRRDGDSGKRPQLGSYITPLFQAPLDVLPDKITINDQHYYLGWHYWLVHEIGPLENSIRARDGIEWDQYLGGQKADDPDPPVDLTAPYATTGDTIYAVSAAGDKAIEIDRYNYDSNIVVLQASTEAAKQITTDVLVHRAHMRYFKLDITVVYSSNSNPPVINAAIGVAVQAFFDRLFFGPVIQLSDLLDVIHQVPGVDNVRWSNDLPSLPDAIRVLETNIHGVPLHGGSIDRLIYGDAGTTETQTLYVGGSPLGIVNTIPDSFTLTWSDPALPSPHILTTAPIPFYHTVDETPLTASDIQTAIRTAATALGVTTGIYYNLAVTLDTRSTTNVVNPIRSFTITYGAHGTPYLPVVTNTVTSSSYTFDRDFFLLDNELPALAVEAVTSDTVPGMIIRPRAQNTFSRPGLG